MKKIREAIMKDIGWKLLSVMIAVGLWFMVINIENPIETRNYTIKINFENEEALSEQGLVVTNLDEIKDTNVIIKVRGERMALDRLSQYRNHIQATADLKKATVSEGNGEFMSLYIEVKLPNSAGSGLEIVSREPAYVPVKIENIVSVERNIEAVINGSTQDGYISKEPEVLPKTVKISGPESLINKVASVKASVTIENPNKNVSIKTSPVAYDSQGNIIDGITFSSDTITVNIGVNKSKRVLVKATTNGTPLNGYTVDSIQFEPKYIDIVGSEDIIENINEISLPAIDVNGTSSDVEKVYNIKDILPLGVELQSGAVDTVKVIVKIGEQATKDIVVNSSKINLNSNGLNASFVQNSIVLTIRGPKDVINDINANNINGSVDIENLSEGTHNVSISFNLPESVDIVGGNSIDVLIENPNNDSVSDSITDDDSNQGTE